MLTPWTPGRWASTQDMMVGRFLRPREREQEQELPLKLLLLLLMGWGGGVGGCLELSAESPSPAEQNQEADSVYPAAAANNPISSAVQNKATSCPPPPVLLSHAGAGRRGWSQDFRISSVISALSFFFRVQPSLEGLGVCEIWFD